MSDWTESEVQEIHTSRLGEKGHGIYISNFHGRFKGEVDVLSVTRSNYCYEHEIKVSRSDLLSELRAVKAEGESCSRNKCRKHAEISALLEDEKWDLFQKRSRSEVKEPSKIWVPNRYYLVCPEEIVDLDEDDIPEHWGVYFVGERRQFLDEYQTPRRIVKVRKAQMIHDKEICEKMLFRICTSLRRRLNSRG